LFFFFFFLISRDLLFLLAVCQSLTLKTIFMTRLKQTSELKRERFCLLTAGLVWYTHIDDINTVIQIGSGCVYVI